MIYTPNKFEEKKRKRKKKGKKVTKLFYPLIVDQEIKRKKITSTKKFTTPYLNIRKTF